MTVYGTGEQTRSFCYVDDTVAGLIALMNSKEIGPINIGNPEERSVRVSCHVFLSVGLAADHISSKGRSTGHRAGDWRAAQHYQSRTAKG